MKDRDVERALRRVIGPADANQHLSTMQFRAMLSIVLSVVVVSLAPVVVTGIMGKVVPDSLIAVSDKTITGLIGVLGTLVGVMWQARPKAEPVPVEVQQPPNNPVPVEPQQ